MVIIFGRSGGGPELNLPSLAGGLYVIFLYVRLVSQHPPFLNNNCTVPYFNIFDNMLTWH